MLQFCKIATHQLIPSWIRCCSYAQTQYNVYWMHIHSKVFILVPTYQSECNIHMMMLLDAT